MQASELMTLILSDNIQAAKEIKPLWAIRSQMYNHRGRYERAIRELQELDREGVPHNLIEQVDQELLCLNGELRKINTAIEMIPHEENIIIQGSLEKRVKHVRKRFQEYQH